MSKAEFIDGLGKSLKGKVDDNEYRKQIEYYSSYISREVSNGKSEDEVVSELGDPRLIAKTIVNTYMMKDNPINNRYRQFEDSDAYSHEQDDYTEEKKGMDKLALKRIFYTILVVCVLLFILSLVTKVILFLAPIVVLFIFVLIVVRFLSKKWL